jgi:4,5-DOPA dioxygenase extradiol
LTYPAKTDLKVADRVVELLKAANIPIEKADRGFDHGVFCPLKVAFPKADIPIVQLSLKGNLNNAEHIRLGEVLQPLREQGVLIVGSGQITHNLRELRQQHSSIDNRAADFCEWINDFLSSVNDLNYSEKKAQLSQVEQFAPNFYFCHPRAEHFTPLAVAFGAAFAPQPGVDACVVEGPRARRLYSEMVLGSMGIDSYVMF